MTVPRIQDDVGVDKCSTSHSLDVGRLLWVDGSTDEPLDHTEEHFLRGDSSQE